DTGTTPGRLRLDFVRRRCILRTLPTVIPPTQSLPDRKQTLRNRSMPTARCLLALTGAIVLGLCCPRLCHLQSEEPRLAPKSQTEKPWTYRPPVRGLPPVVTDRHWARNLIDAF